MRTNGIMKIFSWRNSLNLSLTLESPHIRAMVFYHLCSPFLKAFWINCTEHCFLWRFLTANLARHSSRIKHLYWNQETKLSYMEKSPTSSCCELFFCNVCVFLTSFRKKIARAVAQAQKRILRKLNWPYLWPL